MTNKEFDDIASDCWGAIWKRFNYNSAHWTIIDGRYILKSYSTIVGIEDGEHLWWQRKYSVTTSRHLSQFAAEHGLTLRQCEDDNAKI